MRTPPPTSRHEWRDLLTAHREQLREWADNYPPTFGDKYALVSAEIARLEGRDADAMRLYEQAIQSAREHGFVQNEGLAHEVAARFYAARGFDTIAHAYLRDARRCYLRWGAFGKVRQLEQLHPHLRDDTSALHLRPRPLARPSSSWMSGRWSRPRRRCPARSSSVSSSRRCCGSRSSMPAPSVACSSCFRATSHGSRRKRRPAAARLRSRCARRPCHRPSFPKPCSITVIRTRESVILDDALAQNPFSADEYIRQKHARSVLCLPLVKQAKLIGVLYLENNLASHVFTPARISVLELLASQAAISLENARLYNDLREREARIRRLVEFEHRRDHDLGCSGPDHRSQRGLSRHVGLQP